MFSISLMTNRLSLDNEPRTTDLYSPKYIFLKVFMPECFSFNSLIIVNYHEPLFVSLSLYKICYMIIINVYNTLHSLFSIQNITLTHILSHVYFWYFYYVSK